jgi:hypothetical protein
MKKKSAKPGKSTSPVEVTNVSRQGFWLFVDDRELFVPFAMFPWFFAASIAEIVDVERPSPDHLHWPLLDIDLALESIEDPRKFPLVSRVRRKASPKSARRRSATGRARPRPAR